MFMCARIEITHKVFLSQHPPGPVSVLWKYARASLGKLLLMSSVAPLIILVPSMHHVCAERILSKYHPKAAKTFSSPRAHAVLGKCGAREDSSTLRTEARQRRAERVYHGAWWDKKNIIT
jgi:hypothetical protein